MNEVMPETEPDNGAIVGPSWEGQTAGQERRAQLKHSWALCRDDEAANPFFLSSLAPAAASGNLFCITEAWWTERCRTLCKVIANEYLEEQFDGDEVLQPADIIVRASPIRPFTRRRAVASDQR